MRYVYVHPAKQQIVGGRYEDWTDNETADLNHERHPVIGL
jgi:hypothetical protein